jgi:hypothetical protein
VKGLFSQKALLGSGLLAVLAGILTWIFQSNAGLLIGAFLGGVVVVHQLCFVLTRPARSTIFTTLGIGILAGYSLGTLNTAISLRSYWTLERQFGRDEADLATAMAIALISSGILLLLGQFETPVLPDPPILERRHRILLWIMLGVLLVAYIHGDIGYGGVIVGDGGTVSVLATLGGWISSFLCSVALMAYLQLRRRPGALAYLTLWISSLLLLVPQGRRALFYSLVCNAFVAYWTDRSVLRGIGKKAAIAILALAGVTVSAMIFYSLRMASWQMAGNVANHRVETIFSRAMHVIETDNNKLVFNLQRNVESRTFILCYLSDLATASKTHTPLYGQAALWDVEIEIPSILMPNKDQLRAVGMEENVVNPAFGLKAEDMANSILTVGIGDFGIPGAFVYPLLLGTLVHVFIVVFKKLRVPPVVQAMNYVALLNALLQTEYTLSGYLSVLRGATAVGIFAIILNWITSGVEGCA